MLQLLLEKKIKKIYINDEKCPDIFNQDVVVCASYIRVKNADTWRRCRQKNSPTEVFFILPMF